MPSGPTRVCVRGKGRWCRSLAPPCQHRQRCARPVARHSMRCRHRIILPPYCIVQVVASVFITVFILGLPLGDPKVRCAERSSLDCSGSQISKCFVCYVYNVLLSISFEVVELMDAFQRTLICWLINLYTLIMTFLHQLKLEIYHILQHFDNKDFCETCNLSCDGKESRDLDEKRQSLSKSDKRTL
ncbi:uncharacterized protein [Choristoneura fumiferana]|uniref:uncharacterized protein n=1 Tax=Choristoneura fumiferana TaxID=7141 RepID=UPI003D159260